MNEIKLHIFTDSESIVFYNGERIGIARENDPIDCEMQNQIAISLMPICDINKKLLPYTFKLQLVKNSLECYSEKVDLIDWGNLNYELYCQDYYLNEFNVRQKVVAKKFLATSIGNLQVKILCGCTASIIISNGNEVMMEHQLEHAITDAEIVLLNKDNVDYIVIQGIVLKLEYMCVFGINGKLDLHFETLCHKIEKSDFDYKCLTLLKDMAKHARVETWKLKNKVYEKDESYFVYLKDEKFFNNTYLMPYAFVESIKAKDYKLARKYLTDGLSESLSDLHLENFFGDFIEIYNDRYQKKNNTIAILYQGELKKYIKRFKFEMLDSKINNITAL